MANRLADETSPYLLQHATTRSTGTPGARGARRGRASEDRPILLSVGYSACHWCHVMAHESFEDAETAAFMNELFVNVKVDREERPDLDAIYMEAVQAISGQGGWPMTVFLDPEGVPFYGGTYFPPATAAACRLPDGDRSAAGRLRAQTRGDPRAGAADAGAARRDRRVEPGRSAWAGAARGGGRRGCALRADRERGGFGGAPKFPPASALELLLARGETRPSSSGRSTR